MNVVTLKNIPNVPVEGAERIEGWTGPVSRSRQTIIEPGDSANYNCSVVNFSQGCTTGWHTHTCDQILVVTSGSGMVATEHEQREINVGDVVHIKAGNAIGTAPKQIRQWATSRSPPSAAKPPGARADSDQIGAVIARRALRDEAISTHRALSGPRLLRCRSQ